MADRPKHVASLSDKIAGLKFMQRAKAVQEKNQPAPDQTVIASSSSRTEKDRKGAQRRDTVVVDDNDANEEHWSLSNPVYHPQKRSSTNTSTISHEPGWNAWLDEVDEETRTSKSRGEEDDNVSVRRTFGAWLGKRKQHKEIEGNGDYDRSSEEEDQRSDDEVDSESEVKKRQKGASAEQPGKGKLKGFMKPGFHKDAKSENSKRNVAEQTSKGRSKDAASKYNRRKDDGKKQFVGKGDRSGSLKGFPEQTHPLKKKKKL
ncbi:hypothetical protein CBS101457_001220 [Exobasidium rhododendri]|nr:hypothetical protein CBS101457_001220 [Exobasidium rhododendri]